MLRIRGIVSAAPKNGQELKAAEATCSILFVSNRGATRTLAGPIIRYLADFHRFRNEIGNSLLGRM